ncbi:hypothetical protein Tco_0211234 [Tanacetum coccineum]
MNLIPLDQVISFLFSSLGIASSMRFFLRLMSLPVAPQLRGQWYLIGDSSIHKNHFEVTNCATMEKNVKKISISNASLILEDLDPPLSLYELPFHKEVPGLGALLSFSSENEEKVFNPEILTSKEVHTSLLLELSHRDSISFKVSKNFESPIEIFPCSYGEDIRVLDVLIARIFEASRALGFCPSFTRASHPQLHFGNPIS